MKKILFSLGVLTFLVGCSSSRVPESTQNRTAKSPIVYIDVALLKIKPESVDSYGLKWSSILFKQDQESKNNDNSQKFIVDNQSNLTHQSIDNALSSEIKSTAIIETSVSSFDGESVGFAFTKIVSYLSSVQESMVKSKKMVTMGAESVETGVKIYLTPTVMDNKKIKIKLDGSISYIEDILKLKNGTQFPIVRSCTVNIQTLPLVESGESLLYPVCLLSNYKYYIFISPRIEK